MPPKKHETEESEKENLRTLKILGVELPLTGWAVSILAGVAVLAAVVFIYIKLVDPYLSSKRFNSQDSQLAEYQKHFSETPDWNTSALDGKIRVTHYSSDGCLLVGRRNSDASALIQAWVIDPGRIPQQMQVSPGKITETVFDGESLAEAQTCTGRCINPHPGEFKSWTGQVNGCWIQVWRKWADECLGYAWYNSCYGYFETNPDGTQKMYWVCCVH